MKEPFQELSVELIRQAAHRSASLAQKRRQGGINRYEVEVTKKFGRLIRNVRAERCISMETFVARTDLNSQFLIFLESGLASSQEVAQVLHTVMGALDLSYTDIVRGVLAEESSTAKQNMALVMKSLGIRCTDLGPDPQLEKQLPVAEGVTDLRQMTE